jgi:hypothetical protein
MLEPGIIAASKTNAFLRAQDFAGCAASTALIDGMGASVSI